MIRTVTFQLGSANADHMWREGTAAGLTFVFCAGNKF